jgi:hypothetical protein
VVQVEADPDYVGSDPLVLQYRRDAGDALGIGVRVEDALIDTSQDQVSQVLLSNTAGFTRHLEAGEFVGEAIPPVVVSPPDPESTRAFAVTTGQEDAGDQDRRKKLRECLEEPDLPHEEETLLGFSQVFSLEDGEER